MMSDENASQTENPETEDATRKPRSIRWMRCAPKTPNSRIALLRTVAEMENLRKRTEREVADTRSYAIAGFARDMLSATDALSRALMVLPAEARETADAHDQIADRRHRDDRARNAAALAKHGVKPIEAEGQKFDPHKHQAMFEVPDPSQARRARWCRWCRPALPLATACCAPPWSASPRAARATRRRRGDRQERLRHQLHPWGWRGHCSIVEKVPAGGGGRPHLRCEQSPTLLACRSTLSRGGG